MSASALVVAGLCRPIWNLVDLGGNVDFLVSFFQSGTGKWLLAHWDVVAVLSGVVLLFFALRPRSETPDSAAGLPVEPAADSLSTAEWKERRVRTLHWIVHCFNLWLIDADHSADHLKRIESNTLVFNDLWATPDEKRFGSHFMEARDTVLGVVRGTSPGGAKELHAAIVDIARLEGIMEFVLPLALHRPSHADSVVVSAVANAEPKAESEIKTEPLAYHESVQQLLQIHATSAGAVNCACGFFVNALGGCGETRSPVPTKDNLVYDLVAAHIKEPCAMQLRLVELLMAKGDELTVDEFRERLAAIDELLNRYAALLKHTVQVANVNCGNGVFSGLLFDALVEANNKLLAKLEEVRHRTDLGWLAGHVEQLKWLLRIQPSVESSG